MSTPRVTYFDGRGHGERVRYALAAAGVEWTENTLRAPGDVDDIRELCLFGQVPLLEIDGERVVQSWSIVRYLAATHGPAVAEDGIQWKADAAAEEVRDFFVAANLVGYGWSADKEGPLLTLRNSAARYLPLFEKVLLSNSSKNGKDTAVICVTGSQPCWADYQLLYGLDYTCELLGDDILSNFPYCRKLRQQLRGENKMINFYANKAKRLVDEKYIFEVKAAQEPRKSTTVVA